MKAFLYLASLVYLITAVVSTPIEKRAKAQFFRSCTVPGTVALTFDDGPYVYMNDLVDILNRANVKGTFYFNGNNWRCIYDQDMSNSIKRAFDSGHQIASHTWSHKDMRSLTWDQMHDEMWRVEQAVLRITGAYPAFTRPPFGEFNDLVLEAAGVRGQTITNWDFDSEDGKSATVAAQKALYDAAIRARPSSILSLQHEVHRSSVYEVLPYAIEKLRAAGYRFVTVAECLNLPPYQFVGQPSGRDASWVC